MYRMSQKEMLVFWELIISVILKNKVHIHSRLFRMVTEVRLFESTKKKAM